jgi:hypothetical protein
MVLYWNLSAKTVNMKNTHNVMEAGLGWDFLRRAVVDVTDNKNKRC